MSCWPFLTNNKRKFRVSKGREFAKQGQMAFGCLLIIMSRSWRRHDRLEASVGPACCDVCRPNSAGPGWYGWPSVCGCWCYRATLKECGSTLPSMQGAREQRCWLVEDSGHWNHADEIELLVQCRDRCFPNILTTDNLCLALMGEIWYVCCPLCWVLCMLRNFDTPFPVLWENVLFRPLYITEIL